MIVILLEIFLSATIGYLLGAIPVGYITARIWGVDVLKVGSGRTGGTNVLRSVGILPFVITIAGDLLKGYLAVLIVRILFHNEALVVLSGLAAIFGHNWSIFLKGRGGAGVTPTIGALFGISPILVPLTLGAGLMVIFLSRYVSLGSITGALTLFLSMLGLTLFFQEPWEHLAWGIGACLLIIVAHRPNIERLLRGTERRLGEPAKPLEGG
ncbi:MAG: glycerol-3-phosphate 1-O-acyltransferase PlsY [Chloroflexi bacterium]|nr:glycerol-3-phosphate 1-O-acyltransferase PlsY [Chloroflexota bacterium]